MIDTLSRLIAPLRTRIANMVSRAVVNLIDDSKKMQLLQLGVLTDESRDDVERFQNYGFTSVPQSGAEAVVLFVGGRRDHGLAIAVEDRRYRIRNLESGEVAVYSDQGDKIVIKRGGTIEVTASTKVIVNSPLVELAQPAIDAAVKGTTWGVARATMNSTLAASLSAAGVALNTAGVDPVLVALAPAAATGLVTAGASLTAAGVAPTTFEASAASYLSTKVKVG